MKISRLRLKNWKNFQDIDVQLQNRVFLLGANAAGKSNFLDALRFLRDVAEGGLSRAVASRGGLGAIRCLAARRNSDIELEITLDEAYVYRLKIDHKSKNHVHIPLVAEEFIQIKQKEILQRPDAEDKQDQQRLTQTALEQVNANRNFREIADFLRTISYRHIVPQAVRDPSGFSSPGIPVENDPFGRDIVLQIWNTPKKTRDARLTAINTALKSVVPQLQDLAVVMDEKTGKLHLQAKYSHWRHHGAVQDESQFSDGTLRLLTLLWTLLEEKGPLLLEEPELSLHPEIVRRLPALFAQMTSANKHQIIVSTHSAVMLSDMGIQPDEILMLTPHEAGTQIERPSKKDILLFEDGLSAADICLPRININAQDFSIPI